jgi:two-component system LytT family response regulator
MITSIIIEDSTDAIDSLSGLLKIYVPQVQLIGFAKDVDSGISMINNLKPELVFLDIELKTQTAFDLLSSFQIIDFEVVFVTGHNNYAIEAFDYNALHYLVKPINPEKLIQAVNRLNESKGNLNLEKMKNLAGCNFLSHKNEKRIIVNTQKETSFIYAKDILYVKGEGRYSIICLSNNKKIVVSKVLKEMESQFDTDEFYRVSKTYIINLNHIDIVKHIDGGLVKMVDNTIIQIPRRKRDEFTLKIVRFMSN